MNRTPRLPALAFLLLSAASAAGASPVDAQVATPYALKDAAVAGLASPAVRHLGPPGWAVAGIGVSGIAVPDLLVLGAVWSGDGGLIRERRN